MARYVRDEILTQGLDLASSPTIDAHDRPGGVIQENAYCIKWLQNALDMFHQRYPFSTDVTSVGVTLQAQNADVIVTASPTLYLPENFILPVRNGLIITSSGQAQRVREKSFQFWLDIYNSGMNGSTTLPYAYTIINSRLKIAPLLSASLSATLWYYAQPTVARADSFLAFPDEWTLIEFIRLKAREWTNSIDLGTAQQYMQRELGRLRSAGLIHNSEYDVIPLENNQVFTDRGNSYSWMGSYAT